MQINSKGLGTLLIFSALAIVSVACISTPEPLLSTDKAQTSPTIGSWGFDTTAMDRRVRPGDDFDRYANGAWQDRATIADDRSSVSMFTQVNESVQKQLQTLLEESAAAPDLAPGSNRQILGDWYASYIDEPAIEAAGLKPLQPALERIAAIHTRSDLARYLGASFGFPVNSPLTLNIQPDPKDSSSNIAEVILSANGLSLDDRDAYLDTQHKPRLQHYQEHVERMLALAGFTDTKRRAARVLTLETKLAAALLPSNKIDWTAYHRIPSGEFGQRFPGVDWSTYFAAAGIPGQSNIFVQTPEQLVTGAKLVAKEPLEAWRDYLVYQYLKATAEVLPRAFREEDFDFYTRSLGLQTAMQPRQTLAIESVKERLVRFLGEAYVQRFVSLETRNTAIAMVDEIKRAFDDRLTRLSWLSEQTRSEARKKLAAIGGQIGYPDQWPETTPLQIIRGDALGNFERRAARRAKINLAKLDQPVERFAWDLEFAGSYFVAATIDPTKPTIIVMAGILQPPFFDAAADPAANFGGLGVIIAHELTHQFDKAGSTYDADGNSRDWFAPEDAAKFKAMGEQLAAQMSSYEVLPGVFVDGQNTITETMADLGGLHIAYEAYRSSLKGKEAPIIDGYTGDQRFFLAFAQNWRAKLRDERLKRDTQGGDSHPVFPIRPLMVRNMDAWYQAFDVEPVDKLYLKQGDRLSVW
jgi:putative endopeptidase